MEQLLNLYTWLRTKYPDRSIVVFSTYLKFLDILFYTLKNQHSIAALRFDGTMSLSSREVVRARFNLSSPEIPLLLTAGAGGVGLNITKASIVIQTEIWWNHNLELQAYCRAYRNGQQEDVLVYRLEAVDSPSDVEMELVHANKISINQQLMSLSFGSHLELPKTPEVESSQCSSRRNTMSTIDRFIR